MVAEVSKIQDYAVIRNGRSAALVSKWGSIDWLCWPRFDSASIFGAIIDPALGGRWNIRPANHSQTSQRYIDETNLLETTFSTHSTSYEELDCFKQSSFRARPLVSSVSVPIPVMRLIKIK
jgi:GH15 family glucan-1,4-alpha-glucosidase